MHIFIIVSQKKSKNYLFIGIINDINDINRSFKILYKMSVNNRRKVVYEITFIENEISESKIDRILSDPFYKQRMLKSIMIDKLDESKKK
jgi:hypothetical protein